MYDWPYVYKLVHEWGYYAIDSLMVTIEGIIIWKVILSGRSNKSYKEVDSTMSPTISSSGRDILANKPPGSPSSILITAVMPSSSLKALSKKSIRKVKERLKRTK